MKQQLQAQRQIQGQIHGQPQGQPRFAAKPLPLAISHMFGTGLAAGVLLAAPLAQGAPQGGNVVAGQAAIQQNGNLTTITQGSQRAAIDWRSFNVGSQETVNFVQPNAQSAVLNRVVGHEASAIFGRITANGQVYLVNGNGILFGRTAQVDVGSLAASTANISNADFMAGRMAFNQPGQPGAQVENQGRITVAEGGFAALVGRQVANSGTITARLGKVALAGGDAFVLDLYGDRLVNLIVDPAAMNALSDASGQPLAARVDHTGQIVAESGRVQLSVATVKQLVDNLINLSGVVRATSFSSAPGLISLQGDGNTRVAVSGTLDTSGDARGGRIEVSGRDVALQPGAVLAATGGEGSIAVGGDWQGRGPLAHAQTVTVAQGASLDASGGVSGQGGTVVLWSDTNTQFGGRISAAGGTAGGDAGQVEVSSKGSLGFQGEVDVFAAHGQQGALLLDPLNLTIAATGSGDSQIAADQLRYFLTRGASVNLSADQNVTVDAEINGLLAGSGVRGGGLTLTAGNNLTVNHTIALNDGALTLTATGGTLTQAAAAVLYTGSGSATLSGGAGVTLGQVLSGGAVDIRSASGAITVGNALLAATADGSAAPMASLNVDAAGAVNLNGALVQGNAAVRSRNAGVNLSSAVIQSRAGNVGVNAGTTVSTSAANVGLVAAGTVNATAGQAVDLGVVLSGGVATLTSTGGGVTLHQAVTGGGAAAAGGLNITAAGNVALAGVNAGAGGINITTSSGNITSQGAGAGQGGLLSAGGVTLHANAGQAGTTAAALDVQATAGNVLIDGNTGVHAGTLLGLGSITLASAAGGVAVDTAIAGGAGAVNAATAARPTGIAITARDAIDLSGAVAGTGGITADSSAGSLSLRNASLFSSGAVSLSAAGPITLGSGAGIDTTTAGGSVALTSRTGTVTVGNAGIRAAGDNVNVTLASRGDMAVNGDIQTHSGTIALSSGQGAVRVLASATGTDAAQNATLDAGADGTRSIITVQAAGDVEVGELIAYQRVQLSSDSGNVVLKRGLGGNASGSFAGSPVLLNTGYVDYARGYQAQYRPSVGRLVISAPQGSVELNGLNLDGNASPTDTTPGLQVSAGHRIVSNNEIAVNKGDIELTGGSTLATDGVYLGSSVYSRGYDSVGADGVRGGSDDQKTGYGIRLNGRVLGLYDNTTEMARLPVNTFVVTWYEAGPGFPPPQHQVRTDAAGFAVDAAGLRLRNADGSYQLVGILQSIVNPVASDINVYNVTLDKVIAPGYAQAGVQVMGVRGVPTAVDARGQPATVQQEIAKIEVANNVANYQDAANVSTLVPANAGTAAGRLVQLNTTTVAGVANHTPQTAMHLSDPAPVLTALSQTPIVSAPQDAGVVAATTGIGLKVLGYKEAGDASSTVWSSTITMPDITGSRTFFFRLDTSGSLGAPLTMRDLPSTVPVEGVFNVTVPALATRTYRDAGNNLVTQYVTLAAGTATHTFSILPPTAQSSTTVRLDAVSFTGVDLSSLSASAPAGATQVSAWQATGWNDVGQTGTFRLSSPTLSAPGRTSGVSVAASLYPAAVGVPRGQALQSGAALAPTYTLMTSDYVQGAPSQAPQIPPPSGASPRTYQLSDILADSSATGAYATSPGTRVFLYDGVIDAANGIRQFDSNTGVAIPGLGGIPGFNNSTVGFAGVGAGFGSLAGGTAGSTGVGAAAGQGVTGLAIPGAQGGAGALPVVEDRSAQDAAGAGAADPQAQALPGAADVVFGTRAASQADLGRGGAVPGSAVNVFKRRYRLATAPADTVCAPDAVQQAPAQGTPVRDCPAVK